MPTSQQNDLDFSLLPSVDVGRTFWSLPPEISTGIENYPETLLRAKAAVHFCRLPPYPERTGDENLRLREAYLRAALGEFVTMEETLRSDCPTTNPRRIVDSRNPLLHIIKQLRNLQFHLQTSTLTPEQQRVLFMGDEHDMDIYYIGDLEITDFDKLNDARRYKDSDKIQMLAWFNESQRVWGTADLVRRAVEAFASEIAT